MTTQKKILRLLSSGVVNMSDNFKAAMNKTDVMFRHLCIPLLKDLLPQFDFISIEGNTEPKAQRVLDMNAGIDALAYNEYGVRGIASRIQRYNKNYETFTVRSVRKSEADTEAYKRAVAIDKEYLYPFYTLQAYVEKNRIMSMAICFTKTLFQLIDAGIYYENSTGVYQQGHATFMVVEWSDFCKSKIRIFKDGQGWLNTSELR